MTDDILKSNFQVKQPVQFSEEEKKDVTEKLREKALGSLAGSMVYMERTGLIWEGDEEDETTDE